jgi:hypothetical protein
MTMCGGLVGSGSGIVCVTAVEVTSSVFDCACRVL